MKIILALLAALLLAAPCIAMNDTDEAYLQGLNDGYKFGYLAMAGQTNATAEAQYNGMVADLNSWMDRVGYTGPKWGELPIVANYTLPTIFSSENPKWYLEAN